MTPRTRNDEVSHYKSAANKFRPKRVKQSSLNHKTYDGGSQFQYDAPNSALTQPNFKEKGFSS